MARRAISIDEKIEKSEAAVILEKLVAKRK